ncbi:MAG TPA: hypothetical protein PKN33_07480 [Phycisphaerae bacterium]|nr:hypothetical protein [Phycisphaerae bacterium]
MGKAKSKNNQKTVSEKKTTNKKTSKKTAKKKAVRTRTVRPYPASSFKDALQLGEAIMKYAAGDKVRRLTLLHEMNKSPTSSVTQMMITNSGKYGITKGSYVAESLELTKSGRDVVDPSKPKSVQLRASFELAINGVAPFKTLYESYVGKGLPERSVMKDVLTYSKIEVPDLDECIDTFTVNLQDLNLLRTIGGAETLIPIEQAIDELPEVSQSPIARSALPSGDLETDTTESPEPSDWQATCFYITPIGAEDSLERKHADLFYSHLVKPALSELGLNVIRADHIGEPGMITSQVLHYLKNSRLAIADLSYLNPNVFYEVALRHALRLPVVQMIRKGDRLPFDVNQARTLVLDTTDIYSLVPKLQTYRAEIANQSRKALEDPESVGNPVSVFYPNFYK